MKDVSFRVNEPDVVYQSFEDEVVAIHLPTGVYHSLPGLAGKIFLAMGTGGVGGQEIVEGLARQHEIAKDAIERDVCRFIGELKQHALVAESNKVADANLPLLPNNGQAGRPYQPPVLQSHADLAELFLMDPVHDVSSEGWPNLPTVDPETEPAFQCRLAGSHVILESFAEETVVVNSTSGAFFSLYGPAEDVFLLMPEQPTLDEIKLALSSKYCLDGINLDACVRHYLRNLKDANLLAVEATGTVEEKSARALALVRPGSSLPFSTLSFDLFGPTETETPETIGVPVERRRYRIRSRYLLSGRAGDGMVLMDCESGYYYDLNPPATDAFTMLRNAVSVGDLTEALAGRYEFSGREMAAAVLVFIAHLLRMNLVEAIGASEPAPTSGLPSLEERRPFRGFDIGAHRDLVDLVRPVNPLRNAFPEQKMRASRAKQLCSMLRQCFATATAHSGMSESWFEIANSAIRLRRAGADSAELEKSWNHLKMSGVPRATDPRPLTIHVLTSPLEIDYFLNLLFDKLATNWTAACGPRGELLEFHCEQIPVLYHPGPNVLSVVDLESSEAYFFKPDSAPLPYWEIGSPFRYILHCWFAARGLQFVHGGAVGGPDGGVLLVGKGGSGKSTTSLLCAKAGMTYAGDDYCLVNTQDGSLFSLYNTAKLKGPEDIGRIPEAKGRSQNHDGFDKGGSGKAVFFVSDLWPERLVRGFPLRAILVPRVDGRRESWLEPCSPVEALLAMMPSTVGQLPAAGPADCGRLATLSSKVPAYILHLGGDLEQIPDLVSKAAR
jgi:hypothetical protein